MVSANGQAVFAVVAKDAATKVLKGVGNAFGSMRANALNTFKSIAGAAAVAATAVAGFTIAAIKGAMDDEKASIRLNAALKARGFAMDTLGPKVDAQIKAMQRLGFTDDEVRDGLEVGSRFFKKQSDLLAANTVAANISAATGKPLAAVMLSIGKGAQGSTKGLAALGIQVKKGATLQDILTAANSKYKGVADEIANSTAGKFEDAQIGLNEAFESFGAKFLPRVNDALTFFSNNIMPGVESGLNAFGDGLNGVIDNLTAPGGMVDSVGKVVGPILDDLKPAFDGAAESLGDVFSSVGDLIGALWGDGDGALAAAFKFLGDAIGAAFEVAKPFFDFIKWMVDNITIIIKGANALAGGSQNNVGFNPSFGTQTPATPGGGYKYGSTGTAGAVTVQNTIKFGNDAVSYIDTKLGQGYTYGGSRTNP